MKQVYSLKTQHLTLNGSAETQASLSQPVATPNKRGSSPQFFRLCIVHCALCIAILLGMGNAWGQKVKEFTTTGSAQTWSVGTASKIKIHGIGGGGGGGNAHYGSGGGGGGGAYDVNTVSVDEGSITINVAAAVGAATNGNASTATYGGSTILNAKGGSKGTSVSGGAFDYSGGAGGRGGISSGRSGAYEGGRGRSGGDRSSSVGGGGGGASGPGYPSGTNEEPNQCSGRPGYPEPDNSAGDGGQGGNCGTGQSNDGSAGKSYGGGGGGAHAASGNRTGGGGAQGRVWIEYIKASYRVSPVVCVGDYTGKIIVTITDYGNAADQYDYEYTGTEGGTSGSGSFTGTMTTISNLPAGKYTIVITLHNSVCQAKLKDIQVNATNSLALNAGSVSVTDVKCFGESNGSAEVVNVISNGSTVTDGYSCLWYNNLTPNTTMPGRTINNQPAGIYTVVVTNTSTNCSVTKNNIVISQPSLPLTLALNEKTDVSCKGGSNGTAKLNVNGGTSPYIFSWEKNGTSVNPSFNTSTYTASGLSAGNYVVTVTDHNGNAGCTATASFVIDEPDALQILNCPSNQIVYCDPGQTSSSTAYIPTTVVTNISDPSKYTETRYVKADGASSYSQVSAFPTTFAAGTTTWLKIKV